MDSREDPALRLLEEVPLEPDTRVLAVEGGPGGLLEALAGDGRRLVYHNSWSQAHRAAEERLLRLELPRVRCVLGDLPRSLSSGAEPWPDVPEFPPGYFDAVLCRLGKGTAVLHAEIREAFDLLKSGGSLYLSGHTREGIKSVAKRAEGHFGNLELLAIKSSCRLLRFRKTGAAPGDPIPDPEYWRPVPLALELPGGDSLPYLSKPGLFAYRATDPGTALLARHLPAMAGARVLDMACGSGVLGLAARALGASEVVATDASAAAVSVARRNLAEAGVPGRVLCADLDEGVEGEFDLVLANPPFHRGAETDYGLPGRVLDAALPRLKPGGRLLLVANQFLDYPAQAARHGQACETLAQAQGYKVYRLTR